MVRQAHGSVCEGDSAEAGHTSIKIRVSQQTWRHWPGGAPFREALLGRASEVRAGGQRTAGREQIDW
jgi:hypothetical protein